MAGFDLASINVQSVREIGGKFDMLGFKLTSIAMPSLVSIGGTWTISSPLTTLSAPNLTDIAGSLLLQGDPTISVSLSGLGSLTHVRSIVVTSDPTLVDLRGLEHVRALPEGLALGNDIHLRSLAGLHLDPGPVGILSLSQLPLLQDISPLSAVTSVVIATQGGVAMSNGWLVVVGTKVADLSPLANIANVASRVQIENNASLVHATLNTATAEFVDIDHNPVLTDISLPNLVATHTMQIPKGIGLDIDTNDVLASISFPALTHVDGAGVIVGNPMLPNCQATKLAAQDPATDGWNITDNGSGTCP